MAADVSDMIPNMVHGAATCTVERLHIRAEPNTVAERRGVLVKDQVVDVWAIEGSWVLIQRADGLSGWCARRYLRLGELVRGGELL